VAQQDDVFEVVLDDELHDRPRTVGVVDVLVYPRTVTCDRRRVRRMTALF
jgi:hypothetical protein